MRTAIFEDNNHGNFEPVSFLRPIYEIKTGVFSNAERLDFLPGKGGETDYYCRKELKELLSEQKKKTVNTLTKNEDYLFINGRIILFQKALKAILGLQAGCVIKSGKTIIAAHIKREDLKETGTFSEEIFKGRKEIKIESLNLEENSDYYILEYIWDVIRHFDEVLRKDLELIFRKSHFPLPDGDYFRNPKEIYIDRKADVYPGVVLDATKGKIFIENDCIIEPFTFIKGPAYIGKKVLIKSGTKIYGPVMAGFNSRIAGEISGTILHSFVNKQHDGFIGNSYVSEFVNLGADTVTSNLKNNYSIIKTRNKADTPQINTGMQFLGSIIGDHTKTGINTMLNTGSIIGIFALIAGGDFPDKLINNFAWYITGSKPKLYNIDDALSTAKMVMKRRDVEMTETYETLVRTLYRNTEPGK
jgi:UDP-N-acetylglucosamine diphosphorylase/glucosamine-1-phosphate N-acetyltransferase